MTTRVEAEAMINPQNPLPRCQYCGLDNTVSMYIRPAERGDWPKWTVTCCFCGGHGPTGETPDLAEQFYRNGYRRDVSWEHREGPAQCIHGLLETDLCLDCIEIFRSSKLSK